jgi:hypothetical protein
MNEDDLLNSGEASKYLAGLGLPHTASTLAKLRTLGGGPVYLRIGRNIRYHRHRLREYVAGRTVELSSTSARQPESEAAA